MFVFKHYHEICLTKLCEYVYISFIGVELFDPTQPMDTGESSMKEGKSRAFRLTEQRIAQGILTPALLADANRLEKAKKLAQKLGIKPGEFQLTPDTEKAINISVSEASVPVVPGDDPGEGDGEGEEQEETSEAATKSGAIVAA